MRQVKSVEDVGLGVRDGWDTKPGPGIEAMKMDGVLGGFLPILMPRSPTVAHTRYGCLPRLHAEFM